MNCFSKLFSAASLMMAVAFSANADVVTSLKIVGSSETFGGGMSSSTEGPAFSQDGTTFTYTGDFDTQTFRFIANGNKAVTADNDDANVTIPTTGGDFKARFNFSGTKRNWKMAAAGNYTITVNGADTDNITFNVTCNSEAPVAITSVKILGKAFSGFSSSSAIEMTQDGTTFTYTGEAQKGSFRFLANGNSNCISAAAESTVNIPAEGITDAPAKYGPNNDDNGARINWNLEAEGNYTFIVKALDSANISLTVVNNASTEPEQPETPAIESIAIYGNAFGGFSKENQVELAKDGTTFTYTADIPAGTFRFVTNDNKSITADAASTLAISVDGLENASAKYGLEGSDRVNWNLRYAGNYTITVNAPDTENIKMSVKFNHPSAETFTEMYMIGTATAGGNKGEEATPMVKQDNGTFTFDGELKTNNDKTRFIKFISAQSGSSNNLMLYDPESPLIEAAGLDDAPMALATYDSQASSWRIDETSNYSVVVDPVKMTMSITKTGESSSVSDLETVNAEVSAVYSLQGVKVASADNLPAGLYIVKYANGEIKKIKK